MRQSSLTAIMLLISAPAVCADTYHVRQATYACVDAQATLALNGPARHHAAWRAATRRQGHCFRIRPGESWELVSQPTHFLRLLRRTPPRPGQPPLYFRNTSVWKVQPTDADRRGKMHHPALAIRTMPVQSGAEPAAIASSPAGLQTPAPAPTSTPPAIAAVAAPAAPVPPAIRQIVAPTAARPVRSNGSWRWYAPFLLWALIIASAFLLVRLVLSRPRFRPPAEENAPSARPTADFHNSLGECRKRCVAGLRLAGWEASSRFRTHVQDADVIASSGGRMLAVHCHPSMQPVDTGDVEQACRARDFQGGDLAAIVSNAAFTEPARRLAARNGIVLLHEHQLASFAA